MRGISNNGDNSRTDILSLRRSPMGLLAPSLLSKDISKSTLLEYSAKFKSVSRMESKQLETFHVNSGYLIGYDQEIFQKFCKIKEDAFNLNQDFYVNVRTNES